MNTGTFRVLDERFLSSDEQVLPERTSVTLGAFFVSDSYVKRGHLFFRLFVVFLFVSKAGSGFERNETFDFQGFTDVRG